MNRYIYQFYFITMTSLCIDSIEKIKLIYSVIVKKKYYLFLYSIIFNVTYKQEDLYI